MGEIYAMGFGAAISYVISGALLWLAVRMYGILDTGGQRADSIFGVAVFFFIIAIVIAIVLTARMLWLIGDRRENGGRWT